MSTARYFPTQVRDAMEVIGMWPVAIEVETDGSNHVRAVYLLIGTRRFACHVDVLERVARDMGPWSDTTYEADPSNKGLGSALCKHCGRHGFEHDRAHARCPQ